MYPFSLALASAFFFLSFFLSLIIYSLSDAYGHGDAYEGDEGDELKNAAYGNGIETRWCGERETRVRLSEACFGRVGAMTRSTYVDVPYPWPARTVNGGYDPSGNNNLLPSFKPKLDSSGSASSTSSIRCDCK
ncbi:hypothetical protein C8R43DRAFT_963394 [Mycena crocata]|nr:hypothetical protein C8R43DRAFT_963394 [Mycena crocata]